MSGESNAMENLPESNISREFLGYGRDSVRMLVIDRARGTISSDSFQNIYDYLRSGDMLVVNNSSMMNASLPAYFKDQSRHGKINVGTEVRDNLILVEPRPLELNRKLAEGCKADITGSDMRVELVRRDERFSRYWWADFHESAEDVRRKMDSCGMPITYDHISFTPPLDHYRTLFSRIPGSVEPPSAGIPFTEKVIDSLRKSGVILSEITLHCNLGSLEKDEFLESDRLLKEQYMVPKDTLRNITNVRRSGGRVIAVGTTVVRALESYSLKYWDNWLDGSDRVQETDLFIRDGFRFNVMDGMITGMHDPYSSHIEMMSAVTGGDILESSYNIAKELGYEWHEFGDTTLIL